MSATLVTPKTTSGGEIVRELVNSSDGAGLHLEAGGTITLTNAAAAEFGTSDFSLEFVLNRTANNTNNNVIYESHSAGNNRITLKALTGGDLVTTFTNSSGVNADYNTGYDIDVDLNTVTHYALTFDRSGDLTVYKNGNSVATISIAASSAVDIGASNTNTGRIGYVTTYGVIGTFYRFRTWNKSLSSAEVQTAYERADVPYLEQYGSQTNRLANGDFGNSGSGWSQDGGWTFNTGQGVASGTNSFSLFQPTTILETVGAYTYKYSFDYNRTSGSSTLTFRYYTGSAWVTIVDKTDASGTASGEFTVTGGATNGGIYFYANGTWAGTVDNVVLQRVGCVSDYDLAYAQPALSTLIQDRSNTADGVASSTGVTQVQPITQLNSTSARIGSTQLAAGTAPYIPADGDIVADKIGVGVAPSTLADFKANSTNGATIKLINSDYNNTNEFTAGIGNLDIFANTTTVLGAAYRYLRLGVGTTESIRIDSTGDVTVNESLAIGTSPTSGISLNVRENSTTTAADIRNANASGFGLYVAGGSSSSEYAFRAANKDNTALFTVRGDGLATFSNGINLGDTTLSNYEQGNFTLTDASGAGLTITGGLGFYTRIGNTVHVTVQFTMPTTSNSSAMKLSGLPYAVPNDNDYRGLVLNYSNKTGVEYALTQKNSDDIDFYTDAGANATNADGSGGGFYINGHYKV